MAAAAQKMAAVGKVVRHRLTQDQKMLDVCFRGNVLTNSCGERGRSAA